MVCPRSSNWYVKEPESDARSILFQSSCSSICIVEKSQQRNFTYSVLSNLLLSKSVRTLIFELKGNYSQLERFGEKKSLINCIILRVYLIISLPYLMQFFHEHMFRDKTYS